MAKSDYSKDVFKQLQEVMSKCDSLSREIKTEKRKHKKEITELNQRIEKLETENKKLRDDNERLKKIINNDSNNSSKPPSSDIKKNIPNNREKTNQKQGGQKGHKGHSLSKKIVEEKIKSGEFKHEVIHKGKVQKKYVSKYVLDIEIKTIAKEYRFYKNEEGKYEIPK